MRILFSPRRDDRALVVEKLGDTLSINGEPFDFSVIPDGATLPATAVHCEFVEGTVRRIDGALDLTLLLPYGVVAPGYYFDPEPLVDPADGVLVLPAPPPAWNPEPFPDLPLAGTPATDTADQDEASE